MAKWQKFKNNEQGFTLIELLVVILIIGILSAIAIPAFLNQRKEASIASLKSDLKNASITMETALVKNNSYPTNLPQDFKTSDGVKLKVAGDLNNDPQVAAGWTRVDLIARSGITEENTYTYFKFDAQLEQLIYEFKGPRFDPTSNSQLIAFNYTACGMTRNIRGYVQYSPTIGTTDQRAWLCGNEEKVTLSPSSEQPSTHTIAKEIAVYPFGSPESNAPITSNTKSYCIDGYNESESTKFWKFDSNNGGLKEGKCA